MSIKSKEQTDFPYSPCTSGRDALHLGLEKFNGIQDFNAAACMPEHLSRFQNQSAFFGQYVKESVRKTKLFFAFYFRDVSSGKFIQSNDIPKLYQMPKSTYMVQFHTLLE